MGCTHSPRLNDSLQHRRSRHSVAASSCSRPSGRRQRAWLVSSVSDTVRSARCSPITHHPSAVRCAAWGRCCLFVCISDLIQVIEGQGMARHLHADDTQVSNSCQLDEVEYRLQLNSLKTEVM